MLFWSLVPRFPFSLQLEHWLYGRRSVHAHWPRSKYASEAILALATSEGRGPEIGHEIALATSEGRGPEIGHEEIFQSMSPFFNS